jgi:uncharacterized protein YdeI (YjbR/CyaY-like superfamily)
MILNFYYFLRLLGVVLWVLVSCSERDEKNLFFEEAERTLRKYEAQIPELRVRQEQIIRDKHRFIETITPKLALSDSLQTQYWQRLTLEIENLQSIQSELLYQYAQSLNHAGQWLELQKKQNENPKELRRIWRTHEKGWEKLEELKKKQQKNYLLFQEKTKTLYEQ